MTRNLKEELEAILHEPFTAFVSGSGKIRAVSGKTYFLKSGVASRAYQCEANGLEELIKPASIKIVGVVAVGDDFILTEYIERGEEKPGFFAEFGRQFARIHRYQSKYFGFYENNFIGANPQMNIAVGEEKENWAAFYFNKRLLYQYKLAETLGNATLSLQAGFLKLESKIEHILNGSEEPPCLLHGDLWSGNYLCCKDGDPVLIDPAVYYGHREADLAMTKLFGGFSALFYDAYMEEYPIREGWQYRENIYTLYHVMNHLNIFGRGYLPEAESIVKKYTN